MEAGICIALRPMYWDESVGKLHISSDIQMFHYIIYHEALWHKPFICSWKKLGTLILTVDYKIVWTTGASSLEEYTVKYYSIVYCLSVRWLSRTVVLVFFLNFILYLWTSVTFSWQKRANCITVILCEMGCGCCLFVDRTTYLNELDTKLEGRNWLLDDMFSEVKTLDMKLRLLYKHNSKKILAALPYTQ